MRHPVLRGHLGGRRRRQLQPIAKVLQGDLWRLLARLVYRNLLKSEPTYVKGGERGDDVSQPGCDHEGGEAATSSPSHSHGGQQSAVLEISSSPC